MVQTEDAERALRVLIGIGFTPADAPEDWLLKAYDGEVEVDLLHTPANVPITPATLARATPLEVDSVRMPVMDATDLVRADACVRGARMCFSGPLFTARALREQGDLGPVRAEVGTPRTRCVPACSPGSRISGGEQGRVPPQYLAGRLQRTLAEDPRTAEQEIRVRVVGDDVYLSGQVSCPRRRGRVLDVAREQLPGYRIHDELSVVRFDGPIREERLT